MKLGKPVWGFLADRLDHRIAGLAARARHGRARGFPASTRSSRTAC